MRKIILVAGLGLAIVYSTAQNLETYDSLKRELSKHIQQDSNRVKLLLTYSNAIVLKNTDSAMKYADEALKISETIKWQSGIARAYRQKGLIYYYTSDYTTSIDYSQKALKAAESLHDKLFDALVYNNMANVYADLKQNEKALAYYQKLLDLSEQQHSNKYKLIAVANIANIYVETNNLIKGLEYYKQAIALAEKEKDFAALAFCYSNAGVVYNRLKDYNNALKYVKQSIQISEAANNLNSKATAMNEMAIIYMSLGQYNEMEKYALQSLMLAKQVNNLQWQANAYESLSVSYEKQHKIDKAFSAYKNYMQIHDSIVNVDKISAISRKEAQFDFDKKEAVLNATHAAELKQKQTVEYATIGGSAILIAGSFISFIFYKRKRDAVNKKQEAEFNAKVSDTEIKALRAHMNPHFMFNSLNSINNYITNNNPEAAQDYLTKFAKLMRAVLENSEEKEISLAEDLKALELYMQLEALRLNNKFTYEINIAEDIDKDNTLIPSLLLQPFVENSIWHGIAHKNEGGKIKIDIQKTGDMIKCTIDDNGAGITKTEQQQQERKSLGMKITRSRIEILNAVKKTNASVNVSELEQGTRAELFLPLQLSF